MRNATDSEIFRIILEDWELSERFKRLRLRLRSILNWKESDIFKKIGKDSRYSKDLERLTKTWEDSETLKNIRKDLDSFRGGSKRFREI